MNPERNRENNEIQEINQPKQVELTNAEKDEMKRDLEANPPTLDHQGELEQIKGKVDGQDKRQEENKTLTNTEDVKNQDDGENKNSKEDAKTNVDAQNDVGDKNMRLERTESKPELDIERVKGYPKEMLVHENGETRELTKEEVDAIDKKVEEVEKERAEQKAATEKEYAEKLKGVEPDSREYYELQKEKADRLEAIDNEYDKKSDEVEILKDLHKQGDKLKEGSEKGKTSDISVDRDELKTATLEEKERAEQKAATEKEYAEKLKGVEPDSREYYALQKEKADKLETIDKEYDKKGDEVEILKDLHEQGDKPKERSEKGKTSDISVDRDELKTATPEEKGPKAEAGPRETKEDTKPEQGNVQETGEKTEKNRENNNVKETSGGENEKPKLDVEHVAGHPKDMLVHENGKTRELTKEEVEAIDKKVEEVEKERAEQKAATEKEYAEKLKGVEPDSREYYALQKEKADKLETIDKEYDKKGDEVEILKDLHKQGDKPKEGSEKGKTSDIAIDKDELKLKVPEEKRVEASAEVMEANKETKEEAKPEQDKTKGAKETGGSNHNIKENSGEAKETLTYDVERVKGMPYEMGVHENGKLRSLTKEEAEQIGQRIENAEKEYAAKKAEIEAKIEEKYAKELKEAKPGSSEYYDAQRRKHEEKEAQLSALGKEYQKKTDPVEVFYDMKKQEAKSEEGFEKGTINDEANGKDALKPAAPEEKKPEPAAERKEGNKEAKGEANPEQGKTQGAKETGGSNHNIKENSGEAKETLTYDVERVKGMPYEMGVHENGKLRLLTKEEAEQIGQRIENAEKEYAAKKVEIEAKIEEKYAKELKEAKPDTPEYYDAQRRKHEEKETQLAALDKEYQKKTDPVEVFYDMKKQEAKSEEGFEKGTINDEANGKDALKPAAPEEKKPEPAAERKEGNKEAKGEANPEQGKTQGAKETRGSNHNIKENSGEAKETLTYDVERVKGMPYEMGVHENGKLRPLTKEEAEQIGQRVEKAGTEYAAKKVEIEAKIEEKYAKELKEAKPDTPEYYDAQRRKHEEKETQLAALDKEYQKKTDPVEVFYDMKKQEAKSEEGFEKGTINDEANGKDALKPAAPEEIKPEPAAERKEGNKEAKGEANPEQGKTQGAKETGGSNHNIKENSGEAKETLTYDVERVKDMPYEMGVHENGKLRPLTKEEIEYINNKGEEIVKLTKKEFDYNVKEQLVNVKDKNLQKLKSAVLVSKEALNNFTILGPVNDLKEEYKDRNFTKQLLNDITDNTKNVTIRKKAAQLLVMKACNVLSATAQISLNSSTLSPLAQGLNYVKEKLNSVVYSSLKREYEIEIEEATEIENIEKNYKENFERRTYLIRQAEYNELDSKGYDKYAVDIVDFIKKKYSQEDGFDIKPVKGHPFNVMICKEGKWQDLPKQDIDEVLHYKEAEERKRADYTENMKNKYQKQIDYLEENEKERLNKDKKDIKNKFNKIRDENSDLLH